MPESGFVAETYVGFAGIDCILTTNANEWLCVPGIGHVEPSEGCTVLRALHTLHPPLHTHTHTHLRRGGRGRCKLLAAGVRG